MIDSLIQDLRFAVRTLRRSPGFTLVSVLTLALGIGSNVAMWSVADAVLYRDLPYEDPDSLRVIWQHSPKIDFGPLSFPTYRDLKERTQVFDDIAMFLPRDHNLHGVEGEAERVQGSLVSDNFLDVLGIEPIHGRDFTAEDNRAGAEKAVLVSYELWQRRFGGREDILQLQLRFDDQGYRVVGVLPPGLSREALGIAVLGDVWLPVQLFRDVLPFDDRAVRPNVLAVARVGEASVHQVTDDLVRLGAQLNGEYPYILGDSKFLSADVRQYLIRDEQLIVYLLLAAVGLVLAIAVANLINLQLTRLAQRSRELATRWALGARRRRLLTQLGVESLVLSLAGGGVGLLLALLVLRSFPWLFDGAWAVQQLSPGIFLASFALTLLVAAVIGLIPAGEVIRSSRKSRLAKMQMRATLPNKRLRQALVSLEVALALVTLVGAGLLYGSLEALQKVDPGFATQDRVTFKVILPQRSFEEETPWMSFFDRVLGQLEAVPGVEGVTVTSLLPLEGGIGGSPVAPGDRALPRVPEMAYCSYQMVSPSYFRTLDLPILEGRGLDSRDDDRLDSERVVVISQSLAKIYWPERSSIGEKLAFEFLGDPERPNPRWRRIVGVVQDARIQDLRTPPQCAAYSSYAQIPLWHEGESSPTMSVILHVAPGLSSQVVAETRQIILATVPNLPLFDLTDLSQVIERQIDRSRRVAVLLLALAALSVLLVVVGVLGVVSYVVTARTREIGIRMAFGATASRIVRFFLWQNFSVVMVGVALGLLLAIACSRLVTGLLYQVPAVDPWVYGMASLGLLAISSLAAVFPIWRAARGRPVEALRYE